MLPAINPEMTQQRLNFPTKWQAVIFRNYRVAPTENIAKVLACTVEDVEREAARLGLIPGTADPIWITRGFINIIRSNWYLLPYEQIADMASMTLEKLDFIVAKEDFLFVKLGKTKPECETVKYSPLSDEEIAETERIAKDIAKLDTSKRKYFDFYLNTEDCEPKYVTSHEYGLRMVHPFLSPCADPFIEDTRSHLPDEILDDYARVGVNSFIIHALLAALSPYPIDPAISKDYKIRRKNLRDLIERAGKRGIKIFLYFNEPRAVPEDVFARMGRPDLGGSVAKNGLTSLCLSKEENRKALYDAVYDLFADIPDIGGVQLTTRSEYPTSCSSHGFGGTHKYDCPVCQNLPIETNQVLANNIFNKAIRDAGSDALMIATLWAWKPELVEAGVPKLDEGIGVWHVSEWGLPIERGGVKSEVGEYSISANEPSEWTKRAFELAKGRRKLAKTQVSCSWELAVCPYLPLFDLELEHLVKLREIEATDNQLTWTLGSYPTVTFDMISSYLEAPDTFDFEKWYEKHYGAQAKTVHDAVKFMCKGYREYPFSMTTIYLSPKNMGVANLWSLTPNNNKSCMVGWSYDDCESYAKPYTPEILMSQFEKVIVDWEEGCKVLEGAAGTSAAADELLLFAKVALNHFKADVLHTRYVLAKRALPESKEELLKIFKEERELCLEILELLPKSTLIGFETSNHYFYTERDVIEKLIQLDGLEKELESI